MELKRFISTSLLQIIEGVKEAQSKAEELGAKVNPTNLALSETGISYNPDDINVSRLVEFDVAVTTIEETTTNNSIGVITGVGSARQSEAPINKLKFAIPILYPGSKARGYPPIS